jgi:2'-5' RNA ligase
MRLFVALEVPEGPRQEAERRVREARRALPPARWVDLASLHLTLLFLGAVADERVDGLAAELARACALRRPFSLRLAGGGTFPPRRPARVAWMGVEPGAAAPELAALQAGVAAAADAALAGSGYEPEDRTYHPHVTLARCPVPWPRSAAERFAAVVQGPVGEPFEVARAVLVESRLGRGGARYREAASLPFAGENA